MQLHTPIKVKAMSQNSLLLGSLALGALGAVGIVATVAALDDGDDTGNTPIAPGEPTPGDPNGGVGDEATALHEARLDLARRLGVDPETLRLTSIRDAGFDGCLGVVVDNGVCTEIFIAGAIATFEPEDGSKSYRYHIGGGRFIATDFQDGRVNDGLPAGDVSPELSRTLIQGYLRGDLALALGVDIDDIEVDEFERVRWSDSCLGIAHPAILCAAGVVDGYRAVLKADGKDGEYLYHGALNGPYVAAWALNPGDGYIIGEPLPSDPGQGDGDGGRIKEPRQAMREDLAEKLGVDLDDVDIEDFDDVTWPDGCVGVYRNDALCTQTLIDGWLAILTVDGDDTEYRYHGTYDGGFVAVWELDPANFRIGDPVGN